MNNLDSVGRLAVLASFFGMLVPWSAVQAAPPTTVSRPANAVRVSQVTDVSLAKGGRLNGQLVLEDGTVQANAKIVLLSRGQVVARSQADEQGRFAINGLGGGLYEIAAPGVRRAVRLWAPGTAPPSAKPAVTLAASPLVVRGQYSPGPMVRFIEYTKYPLANPLVFAGIATTAVAIPVAIHNRNKDSGS